MSQSIISTTFSFYNFCALLIGGALGLLIGFATWGLSWSHLSFMASICASFTSAGLLLISKPAEVMSDTLFVGFAECPNRLMTGAHELYLLFDEKTQETLRNEIEEHDQENSSKA